MKQPGAQKRLAMEEKKDAARTKLRGWRPLGHGELQCDFVGKDAPSGNLRYSLGHLPVISTYKLLKI